MEQDIRLAHTLTIILGAWLLAAPIVFSFSSAVAVTNSAAVGFMLVISTAVQAMVKHENGTWINWLHVLLAVWLMIAPFFLHYETATFAVANQVITGSLLFIVATWEEGYEAALKRKWL